MIKAFRIKRKEKIREMTKIRHRPKEKKMPKETLLKIKKVLKIKRQGDRQINLVVMTRASQNPNRIERKREE